MQDLGKILARHFSRAAKSWILKMAKFCTRHNNSDTKVLYDVMDTKNYTLPTSLLPIIKGLVAHSTSHQTCVGSNPTFKSWDFLFPENKILGLVYKSYRKGSNLYEYGR